MQRIDTSKVKGWSTGGNLWRPNSIANQCPHCDKLVVFSPRDSEASGAFHCAASRAACPNCSKIVGFWSLNPDRSVNTKDVYLYMFPAPKRAIVDPNDIQALPDPLRRALVATIDAYNAGIYTATAVSGRRALEGIFKFLLPPEKQKQTLALLIEDAANLDLAEPLRKLSHLIRSGGNLGAHFDMEREPDENMARQMVDLLVYLVDYLYVLPTKISALERHISGETTESNPVEK